jgi:hypothetical protein
MNAADIISDLVDPGCARLVTLHIIHFTRRMERDCFNSVIYDSGPSRRVMALSPQS